MAVTAALAGSGEWKIGSKLNGIRFEKNVLDMPPGDVSRSNKPEPGGYRHVGTCRDWCD